MKLTRNDSVKLKVWINDSVFATEDWVAMTAVEGDSAYVMISDPNSSNKMKIKITQVSEAKLVKDKPAKEKVEPKEKPEESPKMPQE